jgi:hypothetical protein
MVELGRLDIDVHVALLSVYLAQLCVKQMEAVYHIFGYLKAHDRSTMVFDDDYINLFDGDFMEHDWSDFYDNIVQHMYLNLEVGLCKLMSCSKQDNASITHSSVDLFE